MNTLKKYLKENKVYRSKDDPIDFSRISKEMPVIDYLMNLGFEHHKAEDIVIKEKIIEDGEIISDVNAIINPKKVKIKLV